MQLFIYHGPERHKPLVAVAEVQWEGATLGVGSIELKGNAGLRGNKLLAINRAK